MPYQIKEEGDKFCVYNLTTDKKVGDFDSRAQAMTKMKALYAEDKKKPANAKPEKAAADATDDDEDDE